jgi:oxygen-independent coproporphyrinogen-3 oxidase
MSAPEPATSQRRDRALTDERPSLYVHVPFCVTKCHYCDFYSLPADGEPIDATVDALLREAEQRAPAAPPTVFVGGGTPSLLSIAQLERLFDRLDELTGFRASALEVTVECNPESLDAEKAACLLARGATRISIGFQSLHDATLELFGRAHSVADSFRAFEAARSAGANDVNVDFIYAHPELSSAQWRADLERVVALGSEHVSAYNLTFEEDTPFRRWLEQGKLARHSEDIELEQFWSTRARLAAAGLHAYEISNFARAGRECVHNERYWRNADYVGIGPSAVSHVDGMRRGNARSRAKWNADVLERAACAAWEERLEPRARLGETWWLGLRTRRGVVPSLARATAQFEQREDPCEAAAHALARDGFLEQHGERFALSERGLPLADALAQRFLA